MASEVLTIRVSGIECDRGSVTNLVIKAHQEEKDDQLTLPHDLQRERVGS